MNYTGGVNLIYFGENNDYILCECEMCKREMYIERVSVIEQDAYLYHLAVPVKCSCGTIDEYINRSKKSCYAIRHELSALSDLLHKQQNVSNKMTEINAEINKRFNPPTFWQSLFQDFLFALKVFLILLGSVIGIEIFFFIISALMFFFGLAFQMEDLSRAGNELFYNINVFKDRGGAILSKFGFDKVCPILDPDRADKEIIISYIPYAIVGVIIIVFYIFLVVLIIKSAVDIAKLGFFATKVMNQKLKVSQKKEEYAKQLEELTFEFQNLSDQIEDMTILGRDYKNIRAADNILRYFINNRIDTIREAINLFHEEDFRSRLLDYNKAIYNETKQTRRYTKALYMLTEDENIKVDVRDEPAENASKPAESPKNAFSKIKKTRISALTNKKTERLTERQQRKPAYAAIKSADPNILGSEINIEYSSDDKNDRDNRDGDDTEDKTDKTEKFDIFDSLDNLSLNKADDIDKSENKDAKNTKNIKDIADISDISAIFNEKDESAETQEK